MMRYSRVMGLSLILLLSYGIASNAQVIAPTGSTERQASQLVFWYDEDDSLNERTTFIQIANASTDTPVNIHVQIFASSSSDPR